MDKTFTVKMKLLEDYVFQIDFSEFGDIITDEPAPLGSGEGPNPARLLAASVANCLAASLMFAIRKFKEDPGEVSAEVTGAVERVDKFWRITQLNVVLNLGNSGDSIPHLQRSLETFEDYCVVTQSVRRGIDVQVNVYDGDGVLLLGDA